MASDVETDFYQSNQLLRAAHNCVHNALETCHIATKDAVQCLALVDQLYNRHVELGGTLYQWYCQAVASRNPDSIRDYMKTLHRYNRQTVRLTRLFQTNISDYQPEIPEYEFEEDKPAVRPANPERVVQITKFLARLKECLATKEAAV